MDNWDRLLEKYFEGQTNLEEEERLKIYINGSETSENHKPYRMLFVDHDWNSLPTMDADLISGRGRLLQLLCYCSYSQQYSLHNKIIQLKSLIWPHMNLKVKRKPTSKHSWR